MEQRQTKVVVIHDLLTEYDPLIVMLKERYGVENVLLFIKSQEGLDYVLQNLSEKIIVILDLNFNPGEPTGIEVFTDIRKKSSLVYIIIMTASDLSSIRDEDLKNFINNDALALEYATTDYKTILKHVENATHLMDVRVASALEQWIAEHSKEQREEPYLMTRSGKVYNLNQILDEIRLQTPFGQETEKNILLLTIDMLARGKKKING